MRSNTSSLTAAGQPSGGGRKRPRGSLKELSRDSATDRPMLVKEGRFGPYVTDGETNASLRTGDSVETITPERAAELLVLRRRARPGPEMANGGQALRQCEARHPDPAPHFPEVGAPPVSGA